MRFAFLCLLVGLAANASAQQVSIPRVDAMPALPPDYHLRDWDRVTQQYDSLAFDLGRVGTYLPLAALFPGVNYPAYGGAGLETYVGGGNEANPEAINVLPALVGASLGGRNMRTFYGTDWVLRSQQFFNKRPEENVYLNGPSSSSGDDWWYDTMPNVFFYQLRALYPGVGDSDAQFVMVANRWLAAVEALGGSAAPWSTPAINYRAFRLSTMTPLLSGVPEPEAAGALAWILYAAFRQTGDDRYRLGAEWCMEALEARPSNPSYELQLPYGVLAAARMNAELGTHYDIEKLIGWTFTRGPLREWGTLSNLSRGGYTLDGLVGEVDGDGYAFALNGFQQAAALVPVARYDDRFARALGRWMVNLASASRLFYRTSLPDANQDSEIWSAAHDPAASIAYEALRGRWQGISPFATGDAIRGGWAPTNLALYSSSSVGYLAAVVDSTNVPGVLRLDLRKTDFYRGNAFVSYLVYNPYDVPQTVSIPLAFGTYDVYDAATDSWLSRGVSGTASVMIPEDAARVLVFPTTGGTETNVNGQRLVNGIVIDYRVGTPGNQPPRVKALVAITRTLPISGSTQLFCTGDDAEGAVTITWSATRGDLVPSGATATWSSSEVGPADVTCTATDSGGQTAQRSVILSVVSNQAPNSVAVGVTPAAIDQGEQSALTCSAFDPDGDPLTFEWSAEAGLIASDSPGVAIYSPPSANGRYAVSCVASDPSGAEATGGAHVIVGTLVMALPLDGGAAVDTSGFVNGGIVFGADPTADRTGSTGSALLFDGTDDAVTVASSPTLLASEAVTVAAWLKPTSLPNREMFAVSHGSWQNRWKVSITPEGRVRWTVKTSGGTVDLDAPAPLQANVWTHVAATYDGAQLRVYVNGQRVGERPHTGALASTDLPLLLGQMLPGQAAYNFSGALDDVRVYARALSDGDVFFVATGTVDGEAGPEAERFSLSAPYPNPAADVVRTTLTLGSAGHVAVDIVDALGRIVATLLDAEASAGDAQLSWETRGIASGVYLIRARTGSETVTRRVLVAR